MDNKTGFSWKVREKGDGEGRTCVVNINQSEALSIEWM